MYEAIIGAIYLDSGYKESEKFVQKSLLIHKDDILNKKKHKVNIKIHDFKTSENDYLFFLCFHPLEARNSLVSKDVLASLLQ